MEYLFPGDGIVKCLHDLVGQQLLAGRFYFLPGFGFGAGFYGHGHVAADADIGYTAHIEVFHVVDDCFPLGVQQLFVGHDVNVCYKNHGIN